MFVPPEYMPKFNTGTKLRQNLKKIVKNWQKLTENRKIIQKITLFCTISMGVPFKLCKLGQLPYNIKIY